MGTWLKRHGISVLFTMAMALLAGSIALSSTRGTGLCSADPNFLTCLREWVNAAGNFAAVLVAVVALAIAWGQLKANAVMAALPAVNQRIIGGKAMVLIGRRLANQVSNFSELLSTAVSNIGSNERNRATFQQLSKDITAAWEAAFGDMTQIRAIADDVHDIDLENELSAIMQASLYLQDEGWPVVRLFITFLNAERVEEPLSTALYGTSSANLAIIDIMRSSNDIRRFIETCQQKLQELQEVDDRLVAIVQGAKETRLNLLRIIGAPKPQVPSD
jgi:hypothetical protein